MPKLISRDKISGSWTLNDVQDGEYGAEELSNRLAKQQEQLNAAIEKDWKNAFDTSKSATLAPARKQLKDSIAERTEPV